MPAAPVLFLVGPTAVGKSTLAVAVAERCGGEIINADAFQVYAGLDLLSAKPSAEARRGVPHHLFGLVPLGEGFNVARYLELARVCLADIARRGRPAVVVGGTGLYLKALTHGLAPLPPARPDLRAELEALDLRELGTRLNTLDPVEAATVDLKNKRRVVRAVEICLATGGRASDLRAGWNHQGEAAAEPRGFFLSRPRPELHRRVHQRVKEMFRLGVVEEVRQLPDGALGPTAAGMIGLAEIQALLGGQITEVQCRDRLEVNTRQYAKRQCTWFQREAVFQRRELGTADSAVKLDEEAAFMTDWLIGRPATPPNPR